jgi:hypothetical protein
MARKPNATLGQQTFRYIYKNPELLFYFIYHRHQAKPGHCQLGFCL